MSAPLVRKRAVPSSLQLDLAHATKRVKLGQQQSSSADGNASPTACLTPTDGIPRLSAFHAVQPTQPLQQQLIHPDFALISGFDQAGRAFVRQLSTGDIKMASKLTVAQKLHYMSVSERLSVWHKLWSGAADGNELRERVLPSTTRLVDGLDNQAWLIAQPETGSLHSYVQQHKDTSSQNTGYLFAQIVNIVAFCHSLGIVMRDLKLRKFVFIDSELSQLGLLCIDDLVVCDPDNDQLLDRHGCPAYVSPEILDLNRTAYSGKASDMWSVGVLLYVMLTGRYPFYDTTACGLFDKIRQCRYSMPDSKSNVSVLQRVLISSLLRAKPSERPSARHLLATAWLQSGLQANTKLVHGRGKTPPAAAVTALASKQADQVVPSL